MTAGRALPASPVSRGAAIAVTALLHVLALWMVARLPAERPTLPHPVMLMLFQTREPEKAVEPPKLPLELPKQIKAKLPEAPVVSLPQPLREKEERVLHFSAPEQNDGLAVDLEGPESGPSHAAVTDFADRVRKRIQAAKTYPAALARMHNECVINYRVSVDRQGQLLDYRIEGCGNPFLESAARAAVIKAAPYPLPPEFAGERYDVFGSLIYRHS
jgi:protein TonB